MNNGTQKNVLQRILDAASEPRTSAEIAQLAGLAESSVRQRLAIMRGTTPKQAFVAKWVTTPGRNKDVPYYQAGTEECAPYPYKPKRRPTPVRVVEQEPTEEEDAAEPDWVPRRVCNHPVVIRRDFLVAALFGEYKQESSCM